MKLDCLKLFLQNYCRKRLQSLAKFVLFKYMYRANLNPCFMFC